MEFDQDWTEKMINAVRRRPALYDKSAKEYSDRNVKMKLWGEVREAVDSSSRKWTAVERLMREKEIQKRWQNLRTCFKREINEQRKDKSGQASKKRRKYIYFDQLLFLLPTLEDQETTVDGGDLPDAEKLVNNGPQAEMKAEVEESESFTCKMEPLEFEPSQPSYSGERKIYAPPINCSSLNILKDKNDEEFDEDKCFLFSLVPTFRRMTDSQKLAAKIEILQVIQRITTTSPTVPRIQDTL